MKRLELPILGVIGLMVATSAITWMIAIKTQEKSSMNGEFERGGVGAKIPLSSSASPEGEQDQRAAPDIQRPGGLVSRPERLTNQVRLTLGEEDDYVFETTAEIAATSGDYAPLSRFFDGLSQWKREAYFKTKVPNIFSKLGPSHDIREKMALLVKVNAYASSLKMMRVSVLEREAIERYGQMKDEGVLKSLTDEEFAAVCRRISLNRLEMAFAAVEDGHSETARRAAAVAVAQAAIAGGTMAASKAIGKLPAGVTRDEAVAELVLWLRQTNSGEEAAPWEALITDEKAKVRLTRVSKVGSK